MSNPKGKHVTIDPDNPIGLGICDATGFVFKRTDLVKQMEWRGNSLQWTGYLVGKPYLDKPNEQLRTPLLKPDPVSIKDPRGPFASEVVWSNQNVAWEDLEIVDWASWSGSEDGVLAASEEERLLSLQTGNYPPTVSSGGTPPQQPELTQAEILNSLQTFNWGA